MESVPSSPKLVRERCDFIYIKSAEVLEGIRQFTSL